MHVTNLEAMVPRRLLRDRHLSVAEKLLLSAAPIGATARCGPNFNYDDPLNDPANAGGWSKDREIRAKLIRWLCLGEDVSKAVDPRGLLIYGAKITGRLDLSSSTVPFPLTFTRCRLAPDAGDDHSADLSFVTIPALRLNGSSTKSLDLSGAEVKGDVSLGVRFSAEGEVQLVGARIGGSLLCGGGSFRNPLDNALTADRIEVKGSVFLRNGFSADGTVRLVGAQIGGRLQCSDGTFSALNLDTASVKGDFFWYDINKAGSTSVNLTNASVRAIIDDEPSWPGKGNLILDGFVYGRIADFSEDEKRHKKNSGAVTPKDAKARLRWLDRQKEPKPQPYLQLAKVLREMGDDEGAKEVLWKMESVGRADERAELVTSPMRWLFHAGEDAVSDAIVGYGIYPGRAVWYACGLAALGWIVHRRAQRVGAMAPREKDAYDEFSKGQTPVHYQPFNPLIYSVENCLPLVKLGQDDVWQADPHPQTRVPSVASGKFRRAIDSVLDAIVPDWAVGPVILRWLRWIMIGLGWLLATFFLAGLTGIVKAG